MGGVGPLNGPPLDVHAKMAGVYFHSVTRYTHLLYVSQQHLSHPYLHTHTRAHISSTWMIRRIRYIEHTDQHTRPHTRSLTHFHTVNTQDTQAHLQAYQRDTLSEADSLE
jgi:hypothetical protein